MGKTVVYCGVSGSYAEEASLSYFKDADLITAPSFTGAFEAIKLKKADFAVLPIENSSTGAISAVYDLLGEYGFFIVGEKTITITHCLLAQHGTKIEDITEVFSHEQGLYQSRDFLANHPDWKQNSVYNTAAAAQMVSCSENASFAAIASRRSAEIYGLDILCEKTNFKDINQTRFVVIASEVFHSPENNKVSLAFSLPHVSGSLYSILEIFSKEKLNLVKIESRPVADKNWEYLFFLDFTADTIDERVENILKEVSEKTQTLRVLGYYKNAIGVEENG